MVKYFIKHPRRTKGRWLKVKKWNYEQTKSLKIKDMRTKKTKK